MILPEQNDYSVHNIKINVSRIILETDFQRFKDFTVRGSKESRSVSVMEAQICSIG